MNWYENTKTADSWNSGLIKTIGIGSAIAALVVYYNMNTQQASDLVNNKPQEAEITLQKIPKEHLQKNIAKPPEEKQINKPVQTLNTTSTLSIREQIKKHEGKRNLAYKDSEGNMTIGIGFNLERPDAENIINQLGASYKLVYNKKQALNDNQINYLFDINLKEAENIAISFLPNLKEYPQNVQNVVIDMSFNLGSRINQFQQFKKALESKDYISASKEMMNSRWANQVKNRASELSRQMRDAANQQK